jgi:hypothetical protein
MIPGPHWLSQGIVSPGSHSSEAVNPEQTARKMATTPRALTTVSLATMTTSSGSLP